MRLIVGLGNPGNEYVGTRHNVGWEVLDELAIRLGWTKEPEDFNNQSRRQFAGLALLGSAPSAMGPAEKVLLLKPTTYMNLSGQAVQLALNYYHLSPAELMVILDDMALPPGRLRIRGGGSSGGHNGLKDIERALATDQYPRLRLGIDAPPVGHAGRDYVLGRFGPEQRKAVDSAVDRAVSAVLLWMEKGLEASMNAFNGKEDEKGN